MLCLGPINRLGFGEQSPRQFNENILEILIIQIRVLTGQYIYVINLILFKILIVIEMVIFDPSFLILHCGVFGGRGIVDVLKILRDLFRTSNFSFLEL